MVLKAQSLHGGVERVGLKGLNDGKSLAYFQPYCLLLQTRKKIPLQMAYVNDREILGLCFPFFITHALLVSLMRYS